MILVVSILCIGCGQNYTEGSSPPPKPLPRPAAVRPPGHPPVESAPSLATDEPGAITGTIRLSPALSDQLPPNAYLYLIARERANGGAPYAFRRTRVPEFPNTFAMGQADVAKMLGEGIVFADIPEMYLIARIDQDGMAGTQSGDLSGSCTQNPIAAGSRDLEITIEHVH
jgi:hypothetical protein